MGAMSRLALLGALLTAQAHASMTCGDLKAHYTKENCCGDATKVLSEVPGPACPYNFAKPSCVTAEPQAPRDLSTGATGAKKPKAATLKKAQAAFLPLVNIHYHLGAEHRSDDYNDGTAAAAFDAAPASRRLAEGAVRPGWMCPTGNLTGAEMAPYTFQYCKGDVAVGKSYEIHYVHSSAGYSAPDLADAGLTEAIADGLGGAANGRGLLNPMVVVQAQVFQITQGGTTFPDMLTSWTVQVHDDAVMYPGSTTGPSHDNSICSPYAITWHVDKKCHKVSPESFDQLCKQMKETYGLDNDLAPHGSRILLDPAYVVEPAYVKPLA